MLGRLPPAINVYDDSRVFRRGAWQLETVHLCIFYSRQTMGHQNSTKHG